MTDRTALARIDSFPYRHRLRDVMSAPVLTAPPTLSLTEAIRRMHAARVSSIVAVDGAGRTAGIFTERDLLRILSTAGAAGLDRPLAGAMSAPVAAVAAEAFVYVALAKMTRHGFRHLVVEDGDGRPVGVVTGRGLLKVRASEALVVEDTVAEAAGPADLARAVAALPGLAGALLAEGVTAANVAAVVAATVRDMTARAAQLAERALAEAGLGPPPARYALLVLGSAGRGESLLSFDQDNAIVHAGGADDDPWFAELGRRVNATLNAAGIPFCPGGVMAREPAWRRSLDQWKDTVHGWVFAVENQTVMNCDIFFDFVPVWGDRALAEELRDYAVTQAAQSAFFLQYLAQNVANMDNPLGLFGRFLTAEGRLDVKRYALLPLVSAARLRAIRAHLSATGTDERYGALRDRGALHADDWRDFLDVHETVLRLMLDQQLADIAAGTGPSARVAPSRLGGRDRARLRWVFKRLKTLKHVCRVGG